MSRETRMMPVPDGLAGMRVDAGLSKLLGLSRTVVAELAEAGDISQDGRSVGKSDRLAAGAWLDVTLPEPPRDLDDAEFARMEILYADDDVIAVNKLSVSPLPPMGWEAHGDLRPAAEGFRTSPPPAGARYPTAGRRDVRRDGRRRQRACTHSSSGPSPRPARPPCAGAVTPTRRPALSTLDRPASGRAEVAVRDEGATR